MVLPSEKDAESSPIPDANGHHASESTKIDGSATFRVEIALMASELGSCTSTVKRHIDPLLAATAKVLGSFGEKCKSRTAYGV